MRSPKRTPAGRLNQNQANPREAACQDLFCKQVATVVWDFSVDGGAVGTFLFNQKLPPGAVVTNVYTDEQTAVTAATSMTLSAGATALTGATDFTGSSGVNSQALAGGATAIKPSATAYSELSMAIATTPATTGRVRWCVEFYVSKSGNP